MITVSLSDIKLNNIFDLTQTPATLEEEIYRNIYDVVTELGYDDKSYIIYDDESLTKDSYRPDNLPFCLIEAGEIEYDNIFRKHLDSIDIAVARQPFYVGFFDNELLQLLATRLNFIKALRKSGFNSVISDNIYFTREIVSSGLYSFQEIQRQLRDIVFKLVFSYKIKYNNEESLLTVDKALIGSNEYSEINYVEVDDE